MTSRRTNYYGLLDSVRFSLQVPEELRTYRAVAATGAVMIDVLAGESRPLLSTSQAFDNRVVLDLLQGHSDDTIAFLKLVRDGRLLVPGRALPLVAGTSPTSLRNAFAVSLSKPDFVFSGWPELGDPHLRRLALEVLVRDAPVTALGSDALAARLEGVLMLDAALGQDLPPVEGTPLALADQVRAVLAAYRVEEPAHEDAVRDLLHRAASTSADLTTRSGWQELLRERADDPAFEALMSVVDEAYNGVVASSLGVTGTLRTCTTRSVAKSLADLELDAETGALAVDLAEDARHEQWLSWRSVQELSDELAVLDPKRRIRRLEERHVRALVANGDLREKWSIGVLLPGTAALTAEVGTAAAVGGLAAGPVAGLLAGLVALGVDKAVSAVTDRKARRHVDPSVVAWRDSIERPR